MDLGLSPAREAEIADELVQHLEDSEFAGVILTRGGAPGTFRLADAAIDTPGAPDVVVTMRWDSQPGASAAPVRVQT